MDQFKNRRKVLIDMIDDGIVCVPSSKFHIRSNDTEYPFRQNSNFFYLTGCKEDDSLLIISKLKSESKVILYVRENNPNETLWTGPRIGIEKAKSSFGIDDVRDIKTFNKEEIESLLKGHTQLYFDLFSEDEVIQMLKKEANLLSVKRGSEINIIAFQNVNNLVHKMRLIKSKDEINCIKKAISITANAHHIAMKSAKPGLMEYEIYAKLIYEFISNGAFSEAYNAIVAGGNNANILHYTANNDVLKEGDLLLIDAACEYNTYSSDITRTFPINGVFSNIQRRIYQKVLDVQLMVIDKIRPGIRRDELQIYSEELLCQALIDLGALKGELKELLKEKSFKKYAPHGIGHWMGLDVHDPCPYVEKDGTSIILQAGMVMTIEPGIYFPLNDNTIPVELRGIGIRIEDNILVTKDGYENLSSMIAKSIDDIEQICSK